MTAIRARQLCFAYDGRTAIDAIDLDLPAGRLTALLGRNGSGKSTLLRLLAGLLDPDQGSIEVFGRPLSRLPLRERAALIGFLPQQHRPVFPFTVTDAVLTGRVGQAWFAPRPADRERVREALAETGIEPLAGRPYTELSGGERQLVMIARVLAQDPRVVLLDEPTTHLDLANQARLLALVKKLIARGLTVVAALHDPNLAFLHADTCVFLKKGRVIPPDPAEPPWSPRLLEDVYESRVTTIEWADRRLVVPDISGV